MEPRLQLLPVVHTHRVEMTLWLGRGWGGRWQRRRRGGTDGRAAEDQERTSRGNGSQGLCIVHERL